MGSGMASSMVVMMFMAVVIVMRQIVHVGIIPDLVDRNSPAFLCVGTPWSTIALVAGQGRSQCVPASPAHILPQGFAN
jgi:hypothetical protein